MATMPRASQPDSTLAMLRDPYGFISKTCARLGSDVFRTRLLLRPTVCMTGPDAASVFYDESRFTRIQAAPGRIQKTLFGVGGVQGMDGEPHRHRKKMFMSMMSDRAIRRVGELSGKWWQSYAASWNRAGNPIVLYRAVQEILTRTVCEWAGVPLPESEVRRRTRELVALFDYAGRVGPKHWLSRRARNRAERWCASLIEDIRAGRVAVPADSAAAAIASHRELGGELLQPRVAAVELLNVLRPTVAVSVYVVFVALALHRYPGEREKLRGDPAYAELFAQEVRRFFPFFPSVIARVRNDFEWKGFRFVSGTTAVLDLHGINHDSRAWDAPGEFRPERFRNWSGNPFTFVPQGGGDHHVNHRCPGEWITVELMKVAALFLTRAIQYDVAPQDLSIAMTRLPALPRSGVVISNVRLVGDRE